MKNTRQEEEEKTPILVDKALEWHLGVEEREFGTKEEEFRGAGEHTQEDGFEQEMHPPVHGLLQNEEEKSMEADWHFYPKFKQGDKVMAYFPCEGGLFLQSMHDQQEEEKEVQKLDAVQCTCLKEEEGEKVEGNDYNSYPMFRIGDRVIAYDQYVEEEKGKRMEEKRIAAAMQHLAELDIPFPAALNKTLQQREEEGKKKKLEGEKLLPLLLAKKKEGEKEKILDEDDYFSFLFREEAAASANIACVVHQRKRQKRKRKKKKKLEGVQHTLLKVNEVATIEEVTSAGLDFFLQEVQNLFQHDLSFKREGEKEENLQISPSSSHLHKLRDKDAEESTSSDSNFLLHEAHYIATGQHQTNEQQLEEEEGEAEELELLLFQATHYKHVQQLDEEGEKEKLDAEPELPLLEGEEDIAALTCEDLDTLLHEVHHLLQPSASSKEKGEKEEQISPYSLQLHRIKEKCVEDFTESDFNFLLLEEIQSRLASTNSEMK